jgi:hypothetical protein
MSCERRVHRTVFDLMCSSTVPCTAKVDRSIKTILPLSRHGKAGKVIIVRKISSLYPHVPFKNLPGDGFKLSQSGRVFATGASRPSHCGHLVVTVCQNATAKEKTSVVCARRDWFSLRPELSLDLCAQPSHVALKLFLTARAVITYVRLYLVDVCASTITGAGVVSEDRSRVPQA